MDTELTMLIASIAASHGIEVPLVRAIVSVESSGNSYAQRYEPDFNYIFAAKRFAKQLGITELTEIQNQKTSWGLMQIMGAVARELGFVEPLPALCEPEKGVLYGCLKLKSLMGRHKNQNDVIAAYNAGSPHKRSDGTYFNQQYVDKVLTRIKTFKSEMSAG